MTDPSATLPTAPSAVATPVVPPLPAAALKPHRAWDLVLTIILILVGFGAVAVMLFAAVFLVFASDSCGVASCNETQMSLGMGVAIVAPVIVMLGAAIVAIVLLVHRKLAFWVALVGIVGAGLGWGLGAYLVFSAVPGFFGG
jgi:uncharacterized BrkB/YihY/UPF0761 family membrane protein